jgi:membrane peptidoglycan carboxypeptidase
VTKKPTQTSTQGSKPGKKPVDRKARIKKILLWLLIAALAGTLILIGAFVLLYKSIDIPDPNKDFEAQTTMVYYADGKTPLGRFAIQNRDSIPLSEMPQSLQDAVVSAEDRTFWTNKGIDPKGIIRAAFNNARGGETQGASTITQQYVKIFYLSSERSYTRKLKEAILSLKLGREISKKQLLEDYLNTIYFGRGAYGVQAAAPAYFHIDAKDLNLSQSAFLASVLNNPNGYDPANGKAARAAVKARYDYALDGMASMGTADAAAVDKAKRHLPKFPPQEADSRYGGQKGHMLALVRDQLHQLGYSDDVIDGGGLRVTTTFTQKAMAAAKAGVEEARPPAKYLGRDLSAKNLHVAVASVEPGTGALRGFYGGQDYLDSQINWAKAGGMVGSTFKPFTLATALENGYSLKDTFDGNSPYEFPDGLTVRNEGTGSDGLGNDYGAAVSATYALEESINTAFVDMSNSIPDGPDKILKTAEEMGIPPAKPDKRYPGIPDASGPDLEADALITLGKARLSAINMANAYATIANRGQRADVHVLSKVVDTKDGKTWTWKQPQRDGIRRAVADDTSYAMQQVVKSGTGQAALALGRPAAGKTGTATNADDDVSSAWFAGFTPQLSTAVMYVRGDGDNALNDWMPSYFGADYPTDTWLAVMKRDMEGLPVEQFPPPANLDGTAPQDGHSPSPTYVPTTRKPSPSETTTSAAPTTSAPPSTTSAPTTSAPPTGPTDTCGPLGCGSSGSPSPTSSPTASGGASASPAGYTRQRYGED